MLFTVLLAIHIVLALLLIGVILLQQGKGATAGAAFGSGASATVFGARGSASFLTRMTAILAILFFSNCLLLAYMYRDAVKPRSLVEQAQVERAAPSEPAAPAPLAAPPVAPVADVPVPPPAAAGEVPAPAPTTP